MIHRTGSRRKCAFFSLYTGSSIAMCLALPGVAQAACSPDPTPANGTVTCSGADTDGLTINTNNNTVNVQQDATVSSMKSITISNTGSFSPTFNSVTINDNGSITSGLTVESGTPVQGNAYAPTNNVTLNVGTTGSIGGATAIALTSDGSAIFGGGIAGVSIDNAGTIQSRSGAAIVSNGANAGIYTLTNEATGTVGAIQSGVGTLTNRGTIDGGATSAISFGTRVTGPNANFGPATWINSGTIKSSSTVATLDLQTGFYTGPFFTNSGTIANSGSGSAISYVPGPSASQSFTNAAGGTVSSAGGTAIVSTGSLGLTNAGTISGSGTAINVAGGLFITSNTGTINGSVIAGNAGGAASRIDLTGGGTINGNLTLGAGDDMLLVLGALGSATVAGISGNVDAGAGFDRIIYRTTADTTLSTTPAIPASFEAIGLRLSAGNTVTLGTAVSLVTPLDIGLTPGVFGTATLVNQGTISTIGTALTNIFGAGSIALNNSGTIMATLTTTSDFAIQTLGQAAIINSGTISANGGNGINSSGSFTNAGTITATGTTVVAPNALFTNSGTISSTGGTALVLTGSIGLRGTNTGAISGARYGVDLGGYTLTNAGTISSSSGIGVLLDFQATLANQAGGVINGAVSVASGGFATSSSVSNAGSINGNVDFGSGYSFASNNTFIALDGGIVNGNLNLGSGGDRFVTTITNAGAGAYAGVTGKVTGGPNETLIYRVDADTTAALASPSGIFTSTAYDLGNNAKLTLSNATASSGPQVFTGTGSVNLTGDFTGTGARTLFDLTQTSPRAASFQSSNAIALTSSGRVTVTNTSLNSYSYGLVALVGSASSMTNAGTISVQDATTRATGSSLPIAILDNGGTITNTGSLTVGGVTGIFGTVAFGTNSAATPVVVNSGTITQIAGATDAIGVSGTFNLTNSGTISTGGAAILFSNDSGPASMLTNSGTITSAIGPAITDNTGFYAYFIGDGTVINQSSGTISGASGQAAISLVSGVVDNAGAINGDVRLGSVSGTYSYYTPIGSTYIARGGTLNGNLTFGAGDDTLVVIGNSTGVTGKIDAGSGANTYAQAYTTSATIDPTQQTAPASFQTYAVGALGAGTSLTVTGPAAGVSSPLAFFGDGTVDIQVNVNAAPSSQSGANRLVLGQQNAALGFTGGLTFINEAKLADGVTGTVASFNNSGTIGSNSLQFSPVSLSGAAGASFSFANSGSIVGPNPNSASFFLTPSVSIYDANVGPVLRQSASISNSGSIAGGVFGGLAANTLTLTNSGTIIGASTPFNDGALAVSFSSSAATGSQSVPSADSSASFTNTTSGTLNGSVRFSTTAATLKLSNAGSLAGSLNGTQNSVTAFIPGANGSGGTYITPDQLTATFANSGTITSSESYVPAAASLAATAATVTATNSGAIGAQAASALLVLDQTSGSNAVSVTNSGSLTASGAGGGGLLVASTVFQTTPATTSLATVTITNTGSISASGGAAYSPGFNLPDYTSSSQLSLAAGVAVGASAQGGASVSIINAKGASIVASGATSQISGATVTIPAPYDKAGTVGIIAAGDTVTIANSGTITGGPDIPTDANTGAFVSGVSLPLSGAIAGGVQVYAGTATLTNNAGGAINGSVGLAATTSASVTNYGAINGNVTLAAGNDSFVEGIGATLTGTADGGAGTDTLTVDLAGGGQLDAQLARFVNFESTHLIGSGTVAAIAPLATDTLVLDSAALTISSGSTIRTSGPVTLTAGAGSNAITNYGTIAGKVVLGAGNDTFLEGINASTGAVDGGAGTNSLTIDVTGGGNLTQAIVPFSNFQSLAVIGNGTISVTAPLATPTLVLNGATLTLASGSTLQTGSTVALTGGSGTNAFINNGTVYGAIIGIDTINGAGGTVNIVASATDNAKFTNAAADSTLAVTAGTFTLGQKLVNSGIVAVASGATLTDHPGIANLAGGRITVASGGTINDALDNAGTVVNAGTYNADLNNLAGGSATNAAGATWTGTLSNAAGATLANQGTVIGTVANAGTFTNASGANVSGALTQSAGTTTSAGTLAGGAVIAGGSFSTNGTVNGLTNAATTSVTGGTIAGATTNSGTLSVSNGATITGTLTQSAGTTTSAGTLAGGAVINGGSLTTSGTVNGLTNAGTVFVTGGTLAGTIANSGSLTFANGTAITGQITNRAGATLAGTLAFGAGNDTLTLMSGAGATAAIDGGAGSDTLVIASTGTDAVPDEYNLTKITGFEQTTQTSGTIAVSGMYATTQLDIQAGRYIGRTGSVLNAGTVNVASGATFGSGGTVNGNVNVKGTLAPGGTVGAMTVNGNVAFANGSAATFDIGQAASDQLNVAGTVTIASGTTLNLAAVQNNPLKPGSSVDLIVANGGITGSFTTIVKPASILGFVVQRATKISLLGQFLADGSFSAPATNAVNYINSILTGGQASAALLNAIPSLLTSGGNSSAAAFAQLTPEAYASATQIGTDNGLAVAGAMRHMKAVHAPDGGGLFVFAQGLGVWSRLSGNAGLGTSRASQNGGGVLGGIGFGTGTASISGFVGYINARQTIAALGSRTTADGVVAGASARFASGGFSGTATFAFDASSADTKRPVPGGVAETSHYRLRSTTFDIDVGYDLPIGTSWQVRPQVGFTSVRTKRGTAVEAGSAGAFDFTVARDAHSANFVDGGVRLESLPTSTARFRPWLDLGVQYMVDPDVRFATAYLAGGPSGITVAGVGRARTVATVGAGFDAIVAHNVTLFAGYDGAFGKGNSANKVNGGIRVTF